VDSPSAPLASVAGVAAQRRSRAEQHVHVGLLLEEDDLTSRILRRLRIVYINLHAFRPVEPAERLREQLLNFIGTHVADDGEDERTPAVAFIVEASHVFDRDRVETLDDRVSGMDVKRVGRVIGELRKLFVGAKPRVGLLLLHGGDGLLPQLLKFLCGERGFG
jgi:hypothetical protein